MAHIPPALNHPLERRIPLQIQSPTHAPRQISKLLPPEHVDTPQDERTGVARTGPGRATRGGASTTTTTRSTRTSQQQPGGSRGPTSIQVTAPGSAVTVDGVTANGKTALQDALGLHRPVAGQGNSITVSNVAKQLAGENMNRVGLILFNESLVADVRILLGSTGDSVSATKGFLLAAGTDPVPIPQFRGEVWAIRTASTDALISVLEY